MKWEALTSIATISLVVVTMVLVWVTACYNRKIVAEALAMRQAEFKPIIYVSDWTGSDDPGPGNQWFQFCLKNIGRGPAFGIEVCIDGVKPETIVKGVTAVDPNKSLPTCLATGEGSPKIRIFYGVENIATQKLDDPHIVVRYHDMTGRAIESRMWLDQQDLSLPGGPPFYVVQPTIKFVVKDL